MLYVMCGCPGSGKTTWCKKNLANAVYVSTDDIREELFGTPEPGSRSQEKRVFDTFYGRIRRALVEGKDVVADATHTTERGRKKVLDCLPDGQKAVAIVMKTSLRDALYRNATESVLFLSMQSAECFSGCKKSAREKKRAFRKFA